MENKLITPIVALSPPWYTFANEVKYTYGLSSLVQVNDLVEVDGEYILVINVFDDEVAIALRQVLPLTKDFGNVDVDITIFNTKGEVVPVSNEIYTPETLAKLYCTALTWNPLFIGAVLTAGKVPDMVVGSVGNVVLIISKSVVQFYDDDIGELCSNFNEVASKVFLDVSRLEFPLNLKVGFSTYDKDCLIQRDLFCC